MDANDDKDNGIPSYADKHLEKTVWQLEEISGKSNNNRAATMEQLERIGDQHLLHTFLQNSEERHDWNLERMFLHRKTHIDQQEPSTAGDKVEVAQKEYSLEPHSH